MGNTMVVHDLRAVNDSQVEKSEWPDCVRHQCPFIPTATNWT
jgi:hypothetical protein